LAARDSDAIAAREAGYNRRMRIDWKAAQMPVWARMVP
jgi:hypothetical protein